MDSNGFSFGNPTLGDKVGPRSETCVAPLVSVILGFASVLKYLSMYGAESLHLYIAGSGIDKAGA